MNIKSLRQHYGKKYLEAASRPDGTWVVLGWNTHAGYREGPFATREEAGIALRRANSLLSQLPTSFILPPTASAWRDGLIERFVRDMVQTGSYQNIRRLATALEQAGVREVSLLWILKTWQPNSPMVERVVQMIAAGSGGEKQLGGYGMKALTPQLGEVRLSTDVGNFWRLLEILRGVPDRTEHLVRVNVGRIGHSGEDYYWTVGQFTSLPLITRPSAYVWAWNDGTCGKLLNEALRHPAVSAMLADALEEAGYYDRHMLMELRHNNVDALTCLEIFRYGH